VQHAIDHLKKADPVIGAIIERCGPFTMSYREPEFSTLVRSIVYQQLSGKAAFTILNRLIDACGGELTPDRILKLRTEKMRACGLSQQKLSYIRDLAKLTRAGKVNFAGMPNMTDEQVIEVLTQVKGVGVWTAHMFLMFALRRENVLPVGDLGIQNAIKRAYRKRAKVTPKHVEKHGKKWHPYCSVASWYLWRSLEGPAEI
jgi:DNA-3-methyladenine glycosylase II